MGKNRISQFVSVKRKERGLTQEELAEKVGVSTRFIYLLESGKTSVRMDNVNKVLNFFGMELAPSEIIEPKLFNESAAIELEFCDNTDSSYSIQWLHFVGRIAQTSDLGVFSEKWPFFSNQHIQYCLFPIDRMDRIQEKDVVQHFVSHGDFEVLATLIKESSAIPRNDMKTFWMHLLFLWVFGVKQLYLSYKTDDGRTSVARIEPLNQNDDLPLSLNWRRKILRFSEIRTAMKEFGMSEEEIDEIKGRFAQICTNAIEKLKTGKFKKKEKADLTSQLIIKRLMFVNSHF